MFLREYDEEAVMKMLKEEAMEDGFAEGRAEGLARGIQAFVETCKEFGLEEETTIQKCREKFDLDSASAENFVRQYWN